MLASMKRRHFLSAGAASMVGVGAWADAQPPIRLLAGFQAGGSTDMLARIVAAALKDVQGRSVIVDNRPGAGGRLAMELVRASKPGEDIFVVAPQGSLTLFPYVYKNLRYDPVDDFTPISRLITFDYALTVGPGTPARNLAEYVSWVAAHPANAIYSSAGAGTTPHFVGVAFHRAAGAPGAHVPYKGSAQALPDLIAGRVPAMVATMADSLQQHRTGQLRIIGTAGAERSTLVPEVQTFQEAGIPVVVPGWNGLYGPKGIPAARLADLNAAVQKALMTPQVITKLLGLGMVSAPSTSSELAALQKQEFLFWNPIVKSSGFKPEE